MPRTSDPFKEGVTQRIARSGKLTTLLHKGKMPRCPQQLSDEAKHIWRTLGKRLYEIGLLAEVDAFSFAAYCESVSLFLRAQEHITRDGPVVMVGEEERPSAWYKIYLDSQKRISEWSSRFGFTAKDRASMGEMLAALAQQHAEKGETIDGKPDI